VSEPLAVRFGNANGVVFKIRRPLGADVISKEKALIWYGFIQNWQSVGIFISHKHKARFFEIEPANEDGEVAFRSFFVRGKFRVLRHVNNVLDARDAWRLFEAKAAT
jgi:hypothetical protein